MKLYQLPGSCSDASAIVLAEAGILVDLLTVDLREKTLADGSSFLAVNPKGQVPALVLDTGDVLTEGAVILQYLADQAPQTGLLPPHTDLRRYRVLEWLNYIATELHKTFSPLNRPNTPPDFRDLTKTALLPRVFGVLDRRLGESAYLAGDDFTIADAYAFVTLGWAGRQDIDLSSWPNISAYLARVGSRPSVQSVVARRTAVPA
ncbi:glutathione transferase GstA [Xanthobacter autotrophicus]|uniref:glutathione transferase GstA n=1 Tax=Xanthobacter autotrophicus TaxID=280 RepID=UPI00372916AB